MQSGRSRVSGSFDNFIYMEACACMDDGTSKQTNGPNFS